MDQPVAQLKHTPQDERRHIADFIHAHRDLIKEGFRAKIAQQGRSLYDSSDFFSTVQRRADQLACVEGTESTGDMDRLLYEIMREAMADHARATLRDRRLRRSLAGDARAPADSPAPDTHQPDHDRTLQRLHLNPEELNLARFRASGMLHRQVAVALGISAAAVRTRWQRLVGKAHDAGSPPRG